MAGPPRSTISRPHSTAQAHATLQGRGLAPNAERKEVQKMLWRICYERFGITTRIINGDTPSIVAPRTNKATRQASIDEFQASVGFNVIIMLAIAAGMGLNITAANHVIHYSRHWNPDVELANAIMWFELC